MRKRRKIHRKVKGAGAGVGVAGAATVLLVGILERLHVVLTPIEVSALTTLLSAGAALAGGYLTRSTRA